MALKRKASFPTLASSNGTPFCPDAVVIDETPRHLNSRTRKRFRNDRPDDQTVYENTLRLLFSAQKEQASSPSPSLDEPMSPSPSPEAEPIDPRQQTLLKFFKPVRASSSSTRMSQNKENGSDFKDGMMQSHSMDVRADSGSEASLSGEMEMDVEMEMNYTGGDSALEDRRWVGGLGWM
ncbi:hypothetical protein VTN77DRAFT_4041 [Rasamsonia byssochlamydoides]|uniref:uncharacterized protein n=1 Tax=Rasamsonia byssochlamydoides TaxID=89139 RepID=UPI0037421A5C